MSLLYKTGDLLMSDEPAIAHGVNCKGVMGSGIAKSIRAMYGEEMFKEYAAYCEVGLIQPGGLHVWAFYDDDERPWLFNLATQDNPGPDAKLSWILRSVDGMLTWAEAHDISRIGMPWIGCGIGGLKREQVEPILVALTEDHPNVDLIVYTLLED